MTVQVTGGTGSVGFHVRQRPALLRHLPPATRHCWPSQPWPATWPKTRWMDENREQRAGWESSAHTSELGQQPPSGTRVIALRISSHHRCTSALARDWADMVMAPHLGCPLRAHTAKLGSLEAGRPKRVGCCVLPRRGVRQASPGAAVGARRWVGVRAANANTIRAAKKGAPPIMPAVLTPSGPVDLSTLMLRNRIIFVGSQVNSEVRAPRFWIRFWNDFSPNLLLEFCSEIHCHLGILGGGFCFGRWRSRLFQSFWL